MLCDNVFNSLLMCVCHIIMKGYLLTYLLFRTYVQYHIDDFKIKYKKGMV